MKLSIEESQILNGEKGATMRLIFQILYDYANMVGAKKFLNITNNGQIHLSYTPNTLDSAGEILTRLTSHGLSSRYNLFSSPKPYGELIYKSLFFKTKSKNISSLIAKQQFIESELKKLKVKEYNCLCSIRNLEMPNANDIVAWSEPVSVAYINSVLGVKTNELSPLINLFCNVVGKVPEYDLLIDSKRMAEIIVKLDVKKNVSPQLLGETVGRMCEDKIPYIFGLEKILKANLNDFTIAFLKDFCAGFVSSSKKRLFHINGITYEAKNKKKNIIKPKAKTISINDVELQKVIEDYQIIWKSAGLKPKLCIFGCPHLSLYQLINITNEIGWELRQNKRKKLCVKTIFLVSEQTLNEFKNLPEFEELMKYGGIISTFCPLMHLSFKQSLKKNVITNSSKLRSCSSAMIYEEEKLIQIICGRRKM